MQFSSFPTIFIIFTLFISYPYTLTQDISAEVVTLTDETFDSYVQQSEGSQPWFIMFYAPWCPHCNRLKPTWEQLAAALTGTANIGMIDCDQNSKMKDRFSISGFPTLILFRGKMMHEYSGFRNLGNLTEFVLNGYKNVEAEEIPKEGSFWKPLKKTFEKTYKRFSEMLITNPIQIAIMVGIFLTVVIGSCICSAWLITKLAKEDNIAVQPSKGINLGDGNQQQQTPSDDKNQKNKID